MTIINPPRYSKALLLSDDPEGSVSISCRQPFPGSAFFCPDAPRAGVLILHGSEGVPAFYTKGFGHWLAEHGYAALCFGWCGDYIPELPAGPVEIDLLRTFEALRWLEHQVKEKKIIVAGFSMGAEQAAILSAIAAQHAVHYKDNAWLPLPDGLILHAASDVVSPGWQWDWADPKNPWRVLKQEEYPQTNPWRLGDLEELERGTRIEIEHYLGPVLLSHGLNDRIWSVGRSERIEAALRGNPARTQEIRTLFLPGEGHMYSPVGEPRFLQAVLDFLSDF